MSKITKASVDGTRILCTSLHALSKLFKDHWSKNKNEAKFKFQGQPARSQHWFDFDFDFYCIEEIFITHEPDFYRKLYQSHDETQDINTYKMFEVPIRNSKCVGKWSFIVRLQCSSIVKSHWIPVV